MKKLIFSLTLCLSVFSEQLFSQAKLGIDTVVLPDSGNVNTSAIVKIVVKNYGNLSCLQDSVSIVIAIADSNTVTNKTIHPLNNTGGALDPDSSMTVSVTETFNLSKYKKGVNVVVIWPISSQAGVITKDSLYDSIKVIEPNSILERDIRKLVTVYPNPAASHFMITENDIENPIETVVIRDNNGRIINSYAGNKPVDIRMLPDGMYLVEIEFKDKTNGHYKILKQASSVK